MSNHNFSFVGGEILRSIGASWLVAYAYYEKVDATHTSWNKVKTADTRIARYKSCREYHKEWLQEVLRMNPDNLNKNTIGLSAEEIKNMARDILVQM